jgi:hypothetical protein
MVFKDHLQPNREQLLGQFESARNARRIYQKLKEHAMSLQVLQLSVDTSSGIILEDIDVNDMILKMFENVCHWEEEEKN